MVSVSMASTMAVCTSTYLPISTQVPTQCTFVAFHLVPWACIFVPAIFPGYQNTYQKHQHDHNHRLFTLSLPAHNSNGGVDLFYLPLAFASDVHNARFAPSTCLRDPTHITLPGRSNVASRRLMLSLPVRSSSLSLFLKSFRTPAPTALRHQVGLVSPGQPLAWSPLPMWFSGGSRRSTPATTSCRHIIDIHTRTT